MLEFLDNNVMAVLLTTAIGLVALAVRDHFEVKALCKQVSELAQQVRFLTEALMQRGQGRW